MSVILIEHGTLLAHDGTALVETSPGWLAINGDRIAALGAGDAPTPWRERAGRVIDARHMAVLPGLINGHTHLAQTFLRGLADDRPLLRWLEEIIWPVQATMTPDDLYLAAKLGLVENLRCGVTTVVQHHKLPGRDHVNAVARAAADVGLRMLLARGWRDLGPGGESLDHILAEMEWLHDTWHFAPPAPQSWGEAATGKSWEEVEERRSRIRIASGPLAPWRCSDDAMREMVALARSWGVPTHIHVAEAQDEVDLMLARCGKRHIEWLADLDCLGPNTQLVHAVHVTEAELDLIAQAGATVIYCPTSNMYLASGAAPVPKMIDLGIHVALGTDGSGSNNSQDLLECAKIGALLAKHATGDAQALLPADMLRMMTAGGARLWSWGAEDPSGGGATVAGLAGNWPLAVGQLRVGAIADVTIIDLNNARCQPVHSAASALVYNASGADVHTVIVGGQILLDAGRVTILDEATLLQECRHAANALMRRAEV